MSRKQLLAAIVCIVLIQAGCSHAARVSQEAHLISRSSEGNPASAWDLLPSWLDPLQKKKKHTQCDDEDYRKQQLSYIKEMPFIGLFSDVKGTTKFEASGMTIVKDHLWVVFDNLHALGRVNEQFEFRDPRNTLVGELGDDSQFEGLTYQKSTGHFLAVEEVYDDEDHGLHPFVHEIKISDDGKTYTTVAVCPIHFVLTHENKGFEGLKLIEHNGHEYLLGLCEGNYCVGGEQGKEPGNGRVVIAEFNGKSGEECGWDVVKMVDIPDTAYFTDYSGMAFRGDKVGIISQENSTLWIGKFDRDALDFTTDGKVFYFPRDHHCDITYCNVEGIQWLDDVRFVIASDKAKKTQSFKCVAKEQRLSIFALPYGYGGEDK